MLFFLDTASVEEVKRASRTGLIDGVTTNPSLIVRCGCELEKVIEEICKLVSGPVSVEVTEEETEGMLRQAKYFMELGSNVAIKLPLTRAGLEACVELRKQDVMVNMTLGFSAAQALLAAKAGATYVSLFIGRMEDNGEDGVSLISQTRSIYDNFPMLSTQILAASVRNTHQVLAAAELGAEAITMSQSVFYQLFSHPLTDKGVETFTQEWKKYIAKCPSLKNLGSHVVE